MSDEPNLAEVVADRKGERSYDRLATDCGGTPSSGRLHQMATRPLKNFPDPESIKGMTNGLSLTVTEVAMASARSLELNVYTDNGPSALSIGGAGNLPASSKDTLVAVAREPIRLASSSHRADGDHNEQEQESRTQESSPELERADNSASQPGAPIVDDRINQFHDCALAQHYEWLRAKASEDRRMNVLRARPRTS